MKKLIFVIILVIACIASYKLISNYSDEQIIWEENWKRSEMHRDSVYESIDRNLDSITRQLEVMDSILNEGER